MPTGSLAHALLTNGDDDVVVVKLSSGGNGPSRIHGFSLTKDATDGIRFVRDVDVGSTQGNQLCPVDSEESIASVANGTPVCGSDDPSGNGCVSTDTFPSADGITFFQLVGVGSDGTAGPI